MSCGALDVLVAPTVLEPDPASAILAPVHLAEHVKLISTAHAEQDFTVLTWTALEEKEGSGLPQPYVPGAPVPHSLYTTILLSYEKLPSRLPYLLAAATLLVDWYLPPIESRIDFSFLSSEQETRSAAPFFLTKAPRIFFSPLMKRRSFRPRSWKQQLQEPGLLYWAHTN